MKKVLLVGETWFVHKTHIKGFDKFTESSYGEGASWIIEALKSGGYDVTHIANHRVDEEFPSSLEELKAYSLVILSDIGSNTLLLPSSTFNQSKTNPNKCDLIRDYVLEGGGFLMVGGYMAFSGIDGTSRYEETSIQEILPVKCLGKDDRSERPEGITPKIIENHPIFEGIEENWPHFLGYNKTILKEEANLLAEIGKDPFIALGEYGKGRTAAFTSDCAPHWGPTEFIEWTSYNKFWSNLAHWLTKEI